MWQVARCIFYFYNFRSSVENKNRYVLKQLRIFNIHSRRFNEVCRFILKKNPVTQGNILKMMTLEVLSRYRKGIKNYNEGDLQNENF